MALPTWKANQEARRTTFEWCAEQSIMVQMELHYCCTGVTQQQRSLRAIVREYRPGKLLAAQSTESAVCEYRRTPLSASEEQGAAAQTRLIQQHACSAECRIHSTKQLAACPDFEKVR
jgi:hypothetical protein